MENKKHRLHTHTWIHSILDISIDMYLQYFKEPIRISTNKDYNTIRWLMYLQGWAEIKVL